MVAIAAASQYARDQTVGPRVLPIDGPHQGGGEDTGRGTAEDVAHIMGSYIDARDGQ